MVAFKPSFILLILLSERSLVDASAGEIA